MLPAPKGREPWPYLPAEVMPLHGLPSPVQVVVPPPDRLVEGLAAAWHYSGREVYTLDAATMDLLAARDPDVVRAAEGGALRGCLYFAPEAADGPFGPGGTWDGAWVAGFNPGETLRGLPGLEPLPADGRSEPTIIVILMGDYRDGWFRCAEPDLWNASGSGLAEQMALMDPDEAALCERTVRMLVAAYEAATHRVGVRVTEVATARTRSKRGRARHPREHYCTLRLAPDAASTVERHRAPRVVPEGARMSHPPAAPREPTDYAVDEGWQRFWCKTDPGYPTDTRVNAAGTTLYATWLLRAGYAVGNPAPGKTREYVVRPPKPEKE